MFIFNIFDSIFYVVADYIINPVLIGIMANFAMFPEFLLLNFVLLVIFYVVFCTNRLELDDGSFQRLLFKFLRIMVLSSIVFIFTAFWFLNNSDNAYNYLDVFL